MVIVNDIPETLVTMPVVSSSSPSSGSCWFSAATVEVEMVKEDALRLTPVTLP